MPGAELGEDGLDLLDIDLGHAFAAGKAALKRIEDFLPHVDRGRMQAGPDAAAPAAVVELPEPGEALGPNEAPLAGLRIAVGPLDVHGGLVYRRLATSRRRGRSGGWESGKPAPSACR